MRHSAQLLVLIMASFFVTISPASADTGDATPADDDAQQVTVADLMDVQQLFDAHRHQVVSVQTEMAVRTDDLPDFFRGPDGEPSRGEGSGFVVDADGQAITNWHVVARAQSIEVTTANGTSHAARLVGADPSTDIALIEFDAPEPIESARLGTTEQMSPGEWVVAIGSPFGLEQSVTVGVLSAMGRQIGLGPYDDFLQTDASINPGNSGGPLYNLDGEVVGVNTAVIPFGGGIGFAVPIDTVIEILPELRQRGYVVRGFLGAGIQDMPRDLAQTYGVEPRTGVLLRSIDDDGPAAEAGLQSGDIITSIDEQPTPDSPELLSVVAALSPEDTVSIEFVRDEQPQQTQLQVAERPDPRREDVLRTIDPEPATEPGQLGVIIRPVSRELAARFDLDNTSGAFVDRIDAGSPASGVLRQGDIILRIGEHDIDGPGDVPRTLQEQPREEPIRIFVQRDGEPHFVAVRLRAE